MKRLVTGLLIASIGLTPITGVFPDQHKSVIVKDYTRQQEDSDGQTLYDLGLITGTNNGLDEDKELTREEMVTILWRMSTNKETGFVPPATPSFSDVPSHHWAYAIIEEARILGITSGMGDGSFGLGNSVTYQQAVTFMLKALGQTPTWSTAIEDGKKVGIHSDQGRVAPILLRKHIFELTTQTLAKEHVDGSLMTDRTDRLDPVQVSRFKEERGLSDKLFTLKNQAIKEALEYLYGPNAGQEEALKVRYLNLDGKNISDISDLAYFKNLETLSLSSNGISDLSPLRDLNKLNELWIPNNQVTDLGPLQNLSSLVKLNASNNPLNGLEALRDLGNIEVLFLTNSNISQVAPLSNLSNLSTLVLNENTVVDLENLRGLAITNFHYNGVRDLEQAIGTSGSEISPLVFKDKQVEAEAKKRLNKNEITKEDLETLTFFSVSGVTDISDLVHFKNLEKLFLLDNNLVDISPLKELTKLKSLNLSFNSISDLSPLSGLISLESLHLRSNNISSVKPLQTLSHLKVLDLYGNKQIKDLAYLRALALEDFTYNGGIKDLEVAIYNDGLDETVTGFNELYSQLVEGVPVLIDLKAIGVLEGDLDNLLNQVHRKITDTYGNHMVLDHMAITEYGAITKIAITYYDQRTFVSQGNLFEAYKNMNIYGANELVDFSNQELKEQVMNQLNVTSDQLTYSLLSHYPDKLEFSNLTNPDLSDLTNFERPWLISFTNCNIQDFSVLKKFTNLSHIRFINTRISDLSFLEDMTNLQSVFLKETDVRSLTGLSTLTSLTTVDLLDNAIRDLRPLSHLSQLKNIYIYDAEISDLSPLASLSNLEEVILNGNRIKDISPLVNAQDLKVLRLRNTSVADLSMLGDWPHLLVLELTNNPKISDIETLKTMTNATISVSQ